MTLIYILIYLAGYTICLLFFRLIVKARKDDLLTVMERLLIFTFSLLSWIAILIYVIVLLTCFLSKVDLEKKVKW